MLLGPMKVHNLIMIKGISNILIHFLIPKNHYEWEGWSPKISVNMAVWNVNAKTSDTFSFSSKTYIIKGKYKP